MPKKMDFNSDKIFIPSEIEQITDSEIKEVADNLVNIYLETQKDRRNNKQ